MQKPATCQQLQPEDRMAIATMRQRGVNVRAIARILERVQSTIACGVTRHTSAVQSDSSLLRHCVGWLAVLPLRAAADGCFRRWAFHLRRGHGCITTD